MRLLRLPAVRRLLSLALLMGLSAGLVAPVAAAAPAEHAAERLRHLLGADAARYAAALDAAEASAATSPEGVAAAFVDALGEAPDLPLDALRALLFGPGFQAWTAGPVTAAVAAPAAPAAAPAPVSLARAAIAAADASVLPARAPSALPVRVAPAPPVPARVLSAAQPLGP